jgi:hypothetical protein
MADDNNQAVNMAMMLGGMYGPNPYSQFPNGIQGTSYAGAPTDARGRPIQPPPGTTLNSSPVAPPPAPAAAPQAGPMTGGQYGDWRQLAGPSPGGPSTQNQWAYNLGLGGLGPAGSVNPSSAQGQNLQAQAQHPMASALDPSLGGGGGQGNPYQNALSMLANPGHVTTPGANVPATQPVSNQPSVLDQFLAGSNKGGGGAGGYSNQGFFDTLNKLRGNLGASQ